MSCFGKKGEKPSEEKPEPKENPKPNPKPKPFHCEHCGRDGHLAEFCFRRKCEERLARELANKDRYRTSRGVPEPKLVSRGEGMVRTIYPRERYEIVPRGDPPHRVLTQNQLLAPSTQKAEQRWLNTRAGSEACQSIFLKLTKDEK
jgi:hypothetical protein